MTHTSASQNNEKGDRISPLATNYIIQYYVKLQIEKKRIVFLKFVKREIWCQIVEVLQSK